jgi:hypothetical protein
VYKGRWGQFDLWLYNDWFIDPDTGIETPMLADGSVIMSGADLMGTRAFGAILDPAFNYGPMAYAPKPGHKRSCSTVPDDAVLPIVIPSRVNAALCATVV